MSSSQKEQATQDLIRGLELAEYRMLKEKAMRNQTIIQGDGENGWREVSARELFEEIYKQPAPTY